MAENSSQSKPRTGSFLGSSAVDSQKQDANLRWLIADETIAQGENKKEKDPRIKPISEQRAAAASPRKDGKKKAVSKNLDSRFHDHYLVEAAIEGFLLKKGANVLRKWQPRYFTAHGNELKYFSSFAKDECLASIDLSQVEVMGPKGSVFELVDKDDGLVAGANGVRGLSPSGRPPTSPGRSAQPGKNAGNNQPAPPSLVCKLKALSPEAASEWVSTLKALQRGEEVGGCLGSTGGDSSGSGGVRGDSSADGTTAESGPPTSAAEQAAPLAYSPLLRPLPGDLVVWAQADDDIPKGSLGTVLRVVEAPPGDSAEATGPATSSCSTTSSSSSSSSSTTTTTTSSGSTNSGTSSRWCDEGPRVLVRFPPAARVLSAAAAAAAAATAVAAEPENNAPPPASSTPPSSTPVTNTPAEAAAAASVNGKAQDRAALLNEGATFELPQSQLFKVGVTATAAAAGSNNNGPGSSSSGSSSSSSGGGGDSSAAAGTFLQGFKQRGSDPAAPVVRARLANGVPGASSQHSSTNISQRSTSTSPSSSSGRAAAAAAALEPEVVREAAVWVGCHLGLCACLVLAGLFSVGGNASASGRFLGAAYTLTASHALGQQQQPRREGAARGGKGGRGSGSNGGGGGSDAAAETTVGFLATAFGLVGVAVIAGHSAL